MTPRTDNLLIQIKLTPEYTKDKETDRDRALYLCRQLEKELNQWRKVAEELAHELAMQGFAENRLNKRLEALAAFEALKNKG